MNEFSFELIRDVAPQPIVLEPLHTEENGVFAPPAGVNGFSSVEVAVPIPPAPVLTTLSVSENGTYLPPEGTDGFDEVSVDVDDTIYMDGNINDAFQNKQLWDIIKDKLQLGPITSMKNAWFGNYSATLDDEIPTLHIDAERAQVPFEFDAFESTNITHLPNIVIENGDYIEVSNFSFSNCVELLSYSSNVIRPSNQQGMRGLFTNCYKLRSVDSGFLAAITNSSVDNYGGFQNCNSLDEIRGYKAIGNSNSFLKGCFRLKTFCWITDGSGDIGNKTVYMINIGYTAGTYGRTDFLNHTDFTTATEITDAASYAALKNNPDCWTADITYSRYNRASAAETITTLPTNTGTGNPVVQFVGNMGSSTDSGAINTLTAEEIAVATTKGWTVSYQ